MQTYLEQKQTEAFKKKFTVLLFKLTKNRYNIKGFVSLKDRNDVFFHYSIRYMFTFKNDYLKIYSDLNGMTLEEVKEHSDFCIFFNHIGNAKKRDIKLKIHSVDFVEMTFFTVNEKITWEEVDNLWFLDEHVIYNIEHIKVDDGFDCKKVLKEEYKYLFE